MTVTPDTVPVEAAIPIVHHVAGGQQRFIDIRVYDLDGDLRDVFALFVQVVH